MGGLALGCHLCVCCLVLFGNFGAAASGAWLPTCVNELAFCGVFIWIFLDVPSCCLLRMSRNGIKCGFETIGLGFGVGFSRARVLGSLDFAASVRWKSYLMLCVL